MKEFKGHKKEILVKCTLSQTRNYHSKDMANQIKCYNVRTRVQVVKGEVLLTGHRESKEVQGRSHLSKNLRFVLTDS